MSDLADSNSVVSVLGEATFTHPFHDEDADIILRAAHGIKFSCHRIILSKASSVFRDMFTFPAPTEPASQNPPVVDVAETANILSLVLSYCYPGEDPKHDDIDTTRLVLEVMRKYAMDGLILRAAKVLGSFATTEPLRVFAVACCFDLQSVAREAAKQSLKLSMWPLAAEPVPEFQYISASAFQKLLQYHRRCADVATKTLDDLRWVDDGSWAWFQCKRCEPHPASYKLRRGAYTYVPRRWFVDYMVITQKRLVLRPLCPVIPQAAFLTGDLMEDPRKCTGCSVIGSADRMRFSDLLRAHIDDVVSEVS